MDVIIKPVREEYDAMLTRFACTKEQADAVTRIAQASGVSVAEVLRQAVDLFLDAASRNLGTAAPARGKRLPGKGR